MAELGVGAILAIWFLVSAAAQIAPAVLRRIRYYDVFCLVPAWNFFAPIPGTEDLVVLYRTRLDDGSTTAWRQLLREDRYRPWHAVWNPGRRYRKAVFDACQQLALFVEEVRRDRQPTELVRTSIPYLLLINHVSSVEPGPAGAARQFMVMRSTGADKDREPVVVFLSDQHMLSAPSGSR